MTTVELGRDLSLLAELSRNIGIKLIGATGAYHFLPWYFRARDQHEIAELFIQDLTRGNPGTGIKAGVIKCAIDVAGMTPDIQKLTRAAAEAHLATGAPIVTHSHIHSGGSQLQVEALLESGVAPNCIAVGHVGDTDDLELLEALAGYGCFLALDRFGYESILSNERRLSTVVELVRRGFVDRLLISQDACVYNDAVPREVRASQNPEWRLTYLVEKGIPSLRELGLSEEDLTTIFVRNPARLFGSLAT